MPLRIWACLYTRCDPLGQPRSPPVRSHPSPLVRVRQLSNLHLPPGGVLLANDCQDGAHAWDGAREAYLGFCEAHGLQPDVRLGKLGLARKADAG